MLIKKIKNLVKAFNNAYIYDELLNAKDKLHNVNVLIEKRTRELSELNFLYNENKNQIVYSFFSNDEVVEIKNKQIEDNLYYLLNKIKKKIEEEVDLNDKVFQLFVKNPNFKDVIALHFLSKKLNNGKNFKSNLDHTKQGEETDFSSWQEISMTIKVINPNLEINLYANNLQLKI